MLTKQSNRMMKSVAAMSSDSYLSKNSNAKLFRGLCPVPIPHLCRVFFINSVYSVIHNINCCHQEALFLGENASQTVWWLGSARICWGYLQHTHRPHSWTKGVCPHWRGRGKRKGEGRMEQKGDGEKGQREGKLGKMAKERRIKYRGTWGEKGGRDKEWREVELEANFNSRFRGEGV